MCTKHVASPFKALIKGKCPRCRRGNMFKFPVYNLANFQKMHESCEVCGLKFEREIGFYWGAMYISYGFSVAISVTLGIALNILFNDPDVNVYIAVIIGVIVLTSPILFRLSRAIMLHFLGKVKYDPSYKNT